MARKKKEEETVVEKSALELMDEADKGEGAVDQDDPGDGEEEIEEALDNGEVEVIEGDVVSPEVEAILVEAEAIAPNGDPRNTSTALAIIPIESPDFTIHQVVKNLPRKLTEEEYNTKAHELVAIMTHTAHMEMKIQMVKDAYKDQIKANEKSADEIRYELDNGKKMGDVACIVKYFWKEGIKEVWRTDTSEVIESLPISDTERYQQQDMNLNTEAREPANTAA
jgi:hypothetical protein